MKEERTVAGLDEELLTGYLDGVLTQQDEQRVRVHLESSAEARRLLGELRAMREASMSTEFQAPDDRQWDEAGRTVASRGAWRIGLAVLLVWAVGAGGYGLWKAGAETSSWGQAALLWGGVAALAMLLFAALRDRLLAVRTDRYRGVKK